MSKHKAPYTLHKFPIVIFEYKLFMHRSFDEFFELLDLIQRSLTVPALAYGALVDIGFYYETGMQTNHNQTVKLVAHKFGIPFISCVISIKMDISLGKYNRNFFNFFRNSNCLHNFYRIISINCLLI